MGVFDVNYFNFEMVGDYIALLFFSFLLRMDGWIDRVPIIVLSVLMYSQIDKELAKYLT